MKKLYLSLILIFIFLIVSQGGFSQLTNWVRTHGGAGEVVTIDSDYDESGNLYFVGIFSGTVDFNPSPFLSATLTSNGSYDVFITKFNQYGNYQWVKRVGGTGYDNVNSIKLYHGSPGDEGIYITGDYVGTVDFDPSASTDEHTATDGIDAYVLHLDFDGNWRNTFAFSGDGDETIKDIRVMENKFVFVGYYYTQFDVLPDDPGGLFTSGGSSDIIIAAFSPAGGIYWAKSIGSTGPDKALCMDMDDANNFYIAGEFTDSFDFDPGAGTTNISAVDSTDGFMSCFDSDGNLQWVNTVGDTLHNRVTALTVKNDMIWSSVSFEEEISYVSDWMGGMPVYDTFCSNGSYDQLLRIEQTDGTILPDYHRHLKGDGDVHITGMDADERGNIVMTGNFRWNNLDMNLSEEDSVLYNSNGGEDIFLGKYRENYDYIWSHSYGGSMADKTTFVEARRNDTISLGGFFMEEVDFNPGGTAMNRTCQGALDAFFMDVFPYNNETDILSFEFDEQASPAEIDNVNHTVDIEVPFGIDLGSLIPSITVSERAEIQPSDGISTDFTSPVVYTVLAEDSVNTQDWTVSVVWADNTETEILDFVLEEQTEPATIDTADNTIEIEVAYDTDLTQLSPEITISDSATIDPESGTTVDFTNPVVYTVTAEDGVSTQDWTATVSEAEATSIGDTDKYGIKIYPNPASDNIIVETKNNRKGVIAVLNNTGIQVLRKPIDGNISVIDATKLSSGLYFIRIQLEDQFIVKKCLVVD
ncbi:MAG: T9SS type A sorting domain-containing protein [Bacteroidales bacterium]